MRKIVCLLLIFNSLLLFMPQNSYCYAADSKLEIEWEHTNAFEKDRDLDTVSVHILEKISESKNRSVYSGFTITRPTGSVTIDQQTKSSSAVGVGPVYMIRNTEQLSDKLSVAFDMSGGFIVYDKSFPADGRFYNFMWRIGPQFIYKFNEDSSVNLGYMLMHVSNGLRTRNPGYDAHGVSLGFVNKF